MSLKNRIKAYLGLNRNVGVLAVSTLGLALGEELWLAFLPKYLVALGATGFIVGAFSSLKDLLDGIYQYPGGWLGDKVGRKRSLMMFTGTALVGYLVAANASGWEMMFAAMVPIMAWKSGAFPVSFAIIGDSLPQGKRGVAFSVLSVLQRLPRVFGAPMGGLLIATLGIIAGIRVALTATVLLGLVVLWTQRRYYAEDPLAGAAGTPSGLKRILKGMSPVLKVLLVVECIVRCGEALAASFIVLYVLDVRGISAETYGLLFAVQQATAITMYIPSGRLADQTGRRLVIAVTFLFFAMFPLAVSVAESFPLLLAAFFAGGLKEFGEPARKSLIVDSADPGSRGSTVGAYYLIRNLSIVPAGLIGGYLWHLDPVLPLLTASAVSAAGLMAFLVLSRSSAQQFS